MATKKLSAVYVSWPRPDFTQTVKTNKHFRANYNAAMLYAHYEMTTIELKREVVKYLKSKDPKHPLLEKIKDIHENRFATVGKYMYILNHGADVPDDIFSGIMPALERVIDEEEAKAAASAKEAKYIEGKETEDKVVDASPKPVISIQDRLRDKAREVAAEVEGWIDDFIMDKTLPAKTVEEFVNLFKANDLKAAHMRHMYNIFEKRAANIAMIVETKDKDLLEGYTHYTKGQLKQFDLFHRNLLKACGMLQEVAKVERAPRKKKPVSQDKLVSKLKYKKDDSSLGIVSINPVQIIGSKEVWLYNTKTRKLTQYKALDESGLSVKGAAIVNFSHDSVEKTVRKPAETLADFKKASKVKLRTFLKELSTVDVPAPGKVNEHHVILRVDK